jgi:hypothetical protein
VSSCCSILYGYWLISIIDFDRFAPVADTENVSLRITKLELSQRKALGNLKADANAATLMISHTPTHFCA